MCLYVCICTGICVCVRACVCVFIIIDLTFSFPGKIPQEVPTSTCLSSALAKSLCCILKMYTAFSRVAQMWYHATVNAC